MEDNCVIEIGNAILSQLAGVKVNFYQFPHYVPVQELFKC